jgi:hypothetical protein
VHGEARDLKQPRLDRPPLKLSQLPVGDDKDLMGHVRHGRRWHAQARYDAPDEVDIAIVDGLEAEPLHRTSRRTAVTAAGMVAMTGRSDGRANGSRTAHVGRPEIFGVIFYLAKRLVSDRTT